MIVLFVINLNNVVCWGKTSYGLIKYEFFTSDEFESFCESLNELVLDVDGVAVSELAAVVVVCEFVVIVVVVELTVEVIDDVESMLELFEFGDLSSFLSLLPRRTALTRSFAIFDHESILLWANQQAAGPKPLIIIQFNYPVH